MALLTALLVAVGGSLGGSDGMQIMLMFSLAMNFFTYWNSDSLVLKMYGAREIGPNDNEGARQLHEIVDRLAQKTGIPKPKVCVINSDTPNAFATGRNPSHAAVAVTTGIMRILDYDEIEGVLAHEISHIKHRDTLISTVAGSIAGIISTIGQIAQWAVIFGGRGRDRDDNGLGAIFMIVIAPIAAALIQMAISRSREYDADKSAGEITGQPLELASALRKLESAASRMRPIAGVGTATAHLFIVNPLKNASLSFKTLFSTHPSTDDRVAALKMQAEQMGQNVRRLGF